MRHLRNWPARRLDALLRPQADFALLLQLVTFALDVDGVRVVQQTMRESPAITCPEKSLLEVLEVRIIEPRS